jgi:hypothetical protein
VGYGARLTHWRRRTAFDSRLGHSTLPAGLPLDVHLVLMRFPHGFAEGAQLLPVALMAAGCALRPARLQGARGTAPLAVPVLGETAALSHTVTIIL